MILQFCSRRVITSVAFVVAKGNLPHATFPPFLPTLVIAAGLRKLSVANCSLLSSRKKKDGIIPLQSNYAKLPFARFHFLRSFVRWFVDDDDK